MTAELEKPTEAHQSFEDDAWSRNEAPFNDADADAAWPVALFMSTHLAVSVQLRLEGADHTEHRALVIPRHLCVGNRPRLRALLQGVSSLRMRLHKQRCAEAAPRRVLVCVSDRWVPLFGSLPQPPAQRIHAWTRVVGGA